VKKKETKTNVTFDFIFDLDRANLLSSFPNLNGIKMSFVTGDLVDF